MPRHLFLVVQTALLVALASSPALAGGGPENVCLVVNPDSPESMAIANHYMQLRHIPPSNVVYVPWDVQADDATVDSFRKQILEPLLTTLAERKLDGQVDYIVYSSGFPWRVNFSKDVDEFVKKASQGKKSQPAWPKVLDRRGSITALTYLHAYVTRNNLDYVSLTANRYMRPVLFGQETAPTTGFRAAYQFDPSGKVVDSGGECYLLSTMLGVTPAEKRYGLTLDETKAYLSRSAKADGTRPAGKIYYAVTKDVRTTQRAAGSSNAASFAEAQNALRRLNVPTETIATPLPQKKNNVLGLTCGTAKFAWTDSGSTILAGALCDNLTSTGGCLTTTHDQTPITEFLRHGAAGACGTVVEPYLILAKFPSPMLHVHYARGCSLAEAFYQSVHGPYQLLILGDALCQPFARIPQVRLSGIAPGQQVRGTLTLKPEATLPAVTPPQDPNAKSPAVETAANHAAAGVTVESMDHFELFVDGVRTALAKPNEPLTLDTAKLGDGYHELRIVAVGPAPLCTQGRVIVWIVTANHGHSITATPPSGKIPASGNLTVTAASAGAAKIEIRHNGRTLETIRGAAGSATVKADELGQGFNYLQVVGLRGDRPEDEVFARPIVLWVE